MSETVEEIEEEMTKELLSINISDYIHMMAYAEVNEKGDEEE
tara:strand:+ start:812 stop:937 length:126 start_codon:yes stop_codon:yes gene_type:complete